MSKYFVAVKTSPYVYQHFEVPLEVKTYIMQLEHYIKWPEESKLKELYSERFGSVAEW